MSLPGRLPGTSTVRGQKQRWPKVKTSQDKFHFCLFLYASTFLYKNMTVQTWCWHSTEALADTPSSASCNSFDTILSNLKDRIQNLKILQIWVVRCTSSLFSNFPANSSRRAPRTHDPPHTWCDRTAPAVVTARVYRRTAPLLFLVTCDSFALSPRPPW